MLLRKISKKNISQSHLIRLLEPTKNTVQYNSFRSNSVSQYIITYALINLKLKSCKRFTKILLKR